jgi:hypothetical protein
MIDGYQTYREVVGEDAGALPTPPVDHQPLIDRVMSRPLTRRSLLSAAIAMGVIHTLGDIENGIMDEHYGNTETEIVMPGDPNTAQPLSNTSLASSGWNGEAGPTIVDQLVDRKVYSQQFPSAYYRFGGKMSIQSLSETTRQFADRLDPKELDIHGVSEGGIIALTGALGAGRHLRLISVNDSPFDIDDVKHSWLARAAVFANEIGLYQGDVLGKFGTYMLEQIDKNGIKNIGKDDWDYAWHQTWDKLDPRLTMQQLKVLEEANIWNRRDEIKRIMTPDSYLVIMKTEEASTDKITEDNQSTDKWVELATYTGTPYKVVKVPAPGHARISAGYGAAAPHMRDFVDQR